MKSHLKKLSHGQAILHSELTYNVVEIFYLRAWIRNEICPKFGLNLPQVNHFSPPMETIPEASKSSSSNASSPGTSHLHSQLAISCNTFTVQKQDIISTLWMVHQKCSIH
jgi:hypothetical protein